jgi:hypothetical protein
LNIRFLQTALPLLAILCMPMAVADAIDDEVQGLIESVRSSGCVFIRNGGEYSAAEAAAHLQTKYRRGKKHAQTAESFIERLASHSSLSGKPYMLRCEDAPVTPVRDWLFARLAAQRST